MKTFKSILVQTILFLLIPLIYTFVKEKIAMSETGSMNIFISLNQVLAALFGEGLRAVITDWLYQRHTNDKTKLRVAISFGLICSSLIASIYLFIGAAFIIKEDILSFLIDDGIILFLQGLASGYVLWFIYKSNR